MVDLDADVNSVVVVLLTEVLFASTRGQGIVVKVLISL